MVYTIYLKAYALRFFFAQMKNFCVAIDIYWYLLYTNNVRRGDMRLNEVVETIKSQNLNEKQAVEALLNENLNRSEIHYLCMNEVGKGRFNESLVKEALAEVAMRETPVVECVEEDW